MFKLINADLCMEITILVAVHLMNEGRCHRDYVHVVVVLQRTVLRPYAVSLKHITHMRKHRGTADLDNN